MTDGAPETPAARQPRSRGRGATTADLASSRLRRREWNAGELPMRLELEPNGLVLGPSRDNSQPAFPLLLPESSTRVGVVADLGITQLLALRLLEQNSDLTVVTERPAEWRAVADSAPNRSVAILPRLRRWPLEVIPPPWALVVDMPEPPPAGFVRLPWSTVVHLAPRVPMGSGWWQSAHLVLTGRGYARSVAAQRPRIDVSMIESMADSEVLAVDHRGARLISPELTRREFQVLSSIGR